MATRPRARAWLSLAALALLAALVLRSRRRKEPRNDIEDEVDETEAPVTPLGEDESREGDPNDGASNAASVEGDPDGNAPFDAPFTLEVSDGKIRPIPGQQANTSIPRVILCRETSHFRQLAELAPKALLSTPEAPKPSLVLDIGSAYGHATEILASALGDPTRVIGIDVGRHFIKV